MREHTHVITNAHDNSTHDDDDGGADTAEGDEGVTDNFSICRKRAFPRMGVFFTIYYVVFMMSPMIAGGLADLSGSAGAPLLYGSALLISCLAALWNFRRTAGA